MSDKSSSTISIDAPLDQVAATLFAIADYPQWSGAFKKVDVLESDGQGRATKATLSVDAGLVSGAGVTQARPAGSNFIGSSPDPAADAPTDPAVP